MCDRLRTFIRLGDEGAGGTTDRTECEGEGWADECDEAAEEG